MRGGWIVCVWVALVLLAGCGGGASQPALVVNSAADDAAPPPGTVTLRSAIAAAAPGQPIRFDPRLDGATIALTGVADAHTRLKGEVMGIRDEGSGPVSYLVGWFERDYGRSALVARKDVVIDASDLPRGVTLAWAGGESPGARVLAVDGDLTLVNVAVTGGRSVAEAIAGIGEHPQPWTLARGGALAVWGVARLRDCRLYGNRVEGDFDPSRDRGAFGGALWADVVDIDRCVIAGNEVTGGGAAGGGVYVVGGAGRADTMSTLVRSAVSGNRIRGLFAYGGGVYSDGGGIGLSKTLRIADTTIARNLVGVPPGIPTAVLRAQGYWRGGGVYMSNGKLELIASTVAENETRGVARTDSRGRRNLAGGVAATVGDAHAAEHVIVGQSLVVGNVVHEVGGARYAHDLFTGSLVHLRSAGYNRFGTIDFGQMLVPVGTWDWQSLSRRHYPQPGDTHGVDAADVLDLADGVVRAPDLVSAGVDAGHGSVLHLRPRGSALDQVPASYGVDETWAQYRVAPGGVDDFLAVVLARIEHRLGLDGFAAEFTDAFDAELLSLDADPDTPGVQPYRAPDGAPIVRLADVRFFGPARTWPREPGNQPYIAFWRRLDDALAARTDLGPQGLGDAAWRQLFASGPLAENAHITIALDTRTRLRVQRRATDQLGVARGAGGLGDIGAVERP